MEKQYKLKIFILLIGFSSYGYGQTLKTFQGKYEKGTATYSYYESDNLDRIYQGVFNYKSIDSYKGDEEIVSGKFKENRKDGTWKYIIHFKDEKILGVVNRGRKITISGNYIEGELNGLWTYSEIQNGTNKVLIKSSSYFFKGVPVGNYDFFDLKKVDQAGYENQIFVTGQFSKDGLMDGDWNISYQIDGVKYEDKRTYKNGEIEKRLNRNLSSGEILSRETNTSVSDRLNFEYVLSFWQCIDSNTCPGNLLLKLIKIGSNFKMNKNK